MEIYRDREIIEGSYYIYKDNNNIGLSSDKIDVYFNNIAENLVRIVEQYDYVMGCVAWLSSYRILNCLLDKEVQIIINHGSVSQNLQERYDMINDLEMDKVFADIEKRSYDCAISYLGMGSSMMHNKFLLLYSENKRGVWTGSYNFTNNSEKNCLENALYIEDDKVYDTYLEEYKNILIKSTDIDGRRVFFPK